MNQQTIQTLFALLRSAVSGSKLTDEERNGVSVEKLPNLMRFASKHDVAHLLGYGIKQNDFVTEVDALIEKSMMKAIYRCEHLEYEYENLCNTLERSKIPFLPLKGAIIRKCYPEAWMRTSCDIDVLVQKENMEKAMSVLMNERDYTYQKEGSHEIVLFSKNNVVIELHHDLIEEGRANAAATVLKNVWQQTVVRDGYTYWHEMPNELFYFYHIAHMAKHFMSGGCGIKPFIDLWVMEGKLNVDMRRLEKLLRKARLMEFYSLVKKTVAVWFENEPHSNLTLGMEEFILKGGSFGTVDNASVIAAATGVSCLSSFFKLVFISRKNLEKLYPELEHRPVLYPYYQVKRWFQVFNKNKRNKVKHLIDARNAVTKDKIDSATELLDRLGLSNK